MKKPVVKTVEVGVAPFDVERWVRDYVQAVLELEQVKDVAPPAAVRLG